MILGIFDTTLTVPININFFLIDDNIRNSKDICKSKQKDYNLAMEEQKTIKKSAGGAVAQKTFVFLFAINNIYKPIRSTHF